MTTVAENNNTQSTGATSIGLDIRPIGGNIGAEVRGVKLSGELQPATVKALHQAVLKHKVIFVRDQHHLDDAMQEAFGHLLGDLVSHPTVPSLEGTTAILNRVQFETRSANLPKPPGGRPPDSKSMGLELDAV
jgi:alpha-ketoglutarate-dependent taurine dioxygenase